MGTIILPAIIVAAVGLIFGIILTIASKLMFVPVDEKVAAISEALPGANCGACGFAGCDDYATALGENPELETTLCPVGGAAVAAEIASIMGVEAGDVDPQVAMVMCNGNMEATKQIMEADRIHTCKSAKMFYGGNWACSYGCLGIGDCLSVCNYDAIRIINGVAKIDREKCVGCKACTKVCPNHLIDMASKKKLVHVACKSQAKGVITRKSCTNGCIGCMKCQKACKFEAVKIENNLAKIDLDACKNCGLCAKECPTGAIINLRKKKEVTPPPAQAVAE
jgi:RnfABCDGE-type electron transport complex B subunit